MVWYGICALEGEVSWRGFNTRGGMGQLMTFKTVLTAQGVQPVIGWYITSLQTYPRMNEWSFQEPLVEFSLMGTETG